MTEGESDLAAPPLSWWTRGLLGIPVGLLGMAATVALAPATIVSGPVLIGAGVVGAAIGAWLVAPRMPNPWALCRTQGRIDELDPSTLLLPPPGAAALSRGEAVERIEDALDLVRSRSQMRWVPLLSAAVLLGVLLWLAWKMYLLTGAIRWNVLGFAALHGVFSSWAFTHGFYGLRRGHRIETELTAQLEAIRAWEGEGLPPHLLTPPPAPLPDSGALPSPPVASDEPPPPAS